MAWRSVKWVVTLVKVFIDVAVNNLTSLVIDNGRCGQLLGRGRSHQLASVRPAHLQKLDLYPLWVWLKEQQSLGAAHSLPILAWRANLDWSPNKQEWDTSQIATQSK